MKSECEGAQNLGSPNPSNETRNESAAKLLLDESAFMDDDVCNAMSWRYKENLKSAQQLHEVDLTAKQILFLDAILSKNALEWVKALEVFFEIAVIDDPNFERVHYIKPRLLTFGISL